MKPPIPIPDLGPAPVTREATVRITGYVYAVDLGPDAHPRIHHVGKEKRCACPQGSTCPAISVVTDYLRRGGERAPDPPHGFYPMAPDCCPVCDAPAYFEPKLSSKRRGAGWGCSKAGVAHYWLDRARLLQEAVAANPWRFPPVVIRAGEHINAWDGILPGEEEGKYGLEANVNDC